MEQYLKWTLKKLNCLELMLFLITNLNYSILGLFVLYYRLQYVANPEDSVRLFEKIAVIFFTTAITKSTFFIGLLRLSAFNKKK